MNAHSTLTPAGLAQFAGLDDRDLLLLIDYLGDQLSDDCHDAMPSLADPFECVEDGKSYINTYPTVFRHTPADWAAWAAYRDGRLARVFGGAL